MLIWIVYAIYIACFENRFVRYLKFNMITKLTWVTSWLQTLKNCGFYILEATINPWKSKSFLAKTFYYSILARCAACGFWAFNYDRDFNGNGPKANFCTSVNDDLTAPTLLVMMLLRPKKPGFERDRWWPSGRHISEVGRPAAVMGNKSWPSGKCIDLWSKWRSHAIWASVMIMGHCFRSRSESVTRKCLTW